MKQILVNCNNTTNELCKLYEKSFNLENIDHIWKRFETLYNDNINIIEIDSEINNSETKISLLYQTN